MSIKNNLDYIKNEFGNDEKIIENAFKLEILYKRYKYIIWTIGALIVVAILFYGIHIFYKEANAQKYSSIYSSLLENPANEELKNKLQKGNLELYNMFILQQALLNGNIADLEYVSKQKDNLISTIALYHLGSFDRSVEILGKVNKDPLGDLSKFQQAYGLINENKISEAKIILDSIPQNSSLNQMAKLLSHYTISKS